MRLMQRALRELLLPRHLPEQRLSQTILELLCDFSLHHGHCDRACQDCIVPEHDLEPRPSHTILEPFRSFALRHGNCNRARQDCIVLEHLPEQRPFNLLKGLSMANQSKNGQQRSFGFFISFYCKKTVNSSFQRGFFHGKYCSKFSQSFTICACSRRNAT